MFPGYRVERELASGGIATVYLAEDLKHRRRVALNVIEPAGAASSRPSLTDSAPARMTAFFQLLRHVEHGAAQMTAEAARGASEAVGAVLYSLVQG